MIVSLNYQYLYDFTRAWNFGVTKIEDPNGRSIPSGIKFIFNDDINYKQKGGLSAIGLAYAVQIIPKLSFGFTLNFWGDEITNNNDNWRENYHIKTKIFYDRPGLPPYHTDSYERMAGLYS